MRFVSVFFLVLASVLVCDGGGSQDVASQAVDAPYGVMEDI